MSLVAPFPWFGGKRRCAPQVWAAMGNPPNYVEPFAGSLAVLLARPNAAGTETVNDLDCYLANFWRALAADPDNVAQRADWPVNEADLLARHRWLLAQSDFRDRLRADPDYYDAKVAGWWVWGICAWIGSGWCRDLAEQLPHLGDAGRGIADYFAALSDRLRRVRVACGDWTRVLGDSVTIKHGVTGIFLDPPYSADEHSVTYSADSDVAAQVAAWAFQNGDDPNYRIVLCGYDGEHRAAPPGWRTVAWKAQGGYGSQSNGVGRENSERERLYLSPGCLTDEATTPLFSGVLA